MADCIIAGGVESMSFIPMGGYKPTPDYAAAKAGNEDYYWGMGLTAEAVAQQYNISRIDQDEFAFNSHRKALKAQSEGKFDKQIVPITVEQTFINENGKKETSESGTSIQIHSRNGSINCCFSATRWLTNRPVVLYYMYLVN
jgi:acetyl-CoA acyltransferase